MAEVNPGERMVTPLPKESRVWVCRAERDGCTRAVPCRVCLGARNRRKGRKKQNEARKALGVPDSKFASQHGHEENVRHPLFRWECKAGAQINPIATRFLKAEAQSEAAKSLGDPRAFVMTAMPDGMTDGIVLLRLSVWRALIAPALEGPGG